MKVYQVDDNWDYVGIDQYEDSYSGTKTLGIFASIELAEKFIRRYELPKGGVHLMGDDVQLTKDECVAEGIEMTREVCFTSDWLETESHEFNIVERHVIEKLD